VIEDFENEIPQWDLESGTWICYSNPYALPFEVAFPAQDYLCPMKILMVCLGNICRSPLAEGILQAKAEKNNLEWTVESAGTESYHIGEPPHELSQKVARENGIDICRQRARRFVASDFEKYDRLYALSSDVLEEMRAIAADQFDESRTDLLLNESEPGANRDVPDPWYGTEPGYHEAYRLIEKACDAIIVKYGKKVKASPR
jgi:protein-tyrosine phosphatase